MRNIPFAFLDEETIDQINRAASEHATAGVDAFAHLAETQRSMRGLIVWPENVEPSHLFFAVLQRTAKRFVAMLEKMMEMSGPNSIANLERSLRIREGTRRQV
jgi:hypothetical protein